MTMTEGNIYLNLLDLVSNGKCCVMKSEELRVQNYFEGLASVCVCVERTGWSTQMFRTKCIELQEDMKRFNQIASYLPEALP